MLRKLCLWLLGEQRVGKVVSDYLQDATALILFSPGETLVAELPEDLAEGAKAELQKLGRLLKERGVHLVVFSGTKVLKADSGVAEWVKHAK